MKIPLYLKVSLALTFCLAIWVQFSDSHSQDVAPINNAGSKVAHKKAVGTTPKSMEKKDDEIADLFPVYSIPVKEHSNPAPVAHEVALPFQLAGIWLSGGDEIVILSDGNRSWLLCSSCGKKGFIQPGGLLTPDWKLQAIKHDHLDIEWISDHSNRRLDLTSLKIK